MLNKKNNNQYFIIFIIIGLFFAFNLATGASQQLTADEIIDKVKENQADYQNRKKKGVSLSTFDITSFWD